MKQAADDTREMAGEEGEEYDASASSPATLLNESCPGFRVRLPFLVRLVA